MNVNFDTLVSIIIGRGKKHRSITAIAGPPCSGKSTLAVSLCAKINSFERDSANVFQMDGFHYDDTVLEKLNLLDKKGSPNTFDIGGFTAMLKRLSEDRENAIAVPVFDRQLEISRNSSNLIDTSTRHLIVEGNYLMLKDKPWTDLQLYYDTTIFVHAPSTTIRKRLENRWISLTKEAREKKILKNDLPNVKYVLENSANSEFSYEIGES